VRRLRRCAAGLHDPDRPGEDIATKRVEDNVEVLDVVLPTVLLDVDELVGSEVEDQGLHLRPAAADDA
jgi:hypothetical protein